MREAFKSLSYLINIIGNFAVFWLLSFLFAVVIWLKGWHEEAVLFIVAFLLMHAVVMGIKIVFPTARPKNSRVFAVTAAFPSGHAAASGFVATIVPYLLYPYISQQLLLITTFTLLIIALTVSISRLSLRVHTPTQVLAGLVIGAAVSFVVIVCREAITAIFF